MDELKPGDLRLRAMNLLARREHLRAELSRKLRQRFGTDNELAIESVLDDLEEENLLSDSRFTQSYIRHRSARGYGPDRIRQELRQKGVDVQLLEESMSVAEVDWADRARDVRRKKFGEEEPGDFREKARQLRFLNYRGFGSEYASAAVDFDA
jgi:regulatory protein